VFAKLTSRVKVAPVLLKKGGSQAVFIEHIRELVESVRYAGGAREDSRPPNSKKTRGAGAAGARRAVGRPRSAKK
jgi:hypothetical protein